MKAKNNVILKNTGFIILLILILMSRPILIIGNSMMPTLKDKSFHVGLNKYVSRFFIHRGSIIAFSTDESNEVTDGKTLVKRVIGMPGDHVKITNGIVYINGEKIDEPYIMEVSKGDNFDLAVPEGKVFCMGDNRNNSSDSRLKAIGYVDVVEQLESIYLF